MRSGSPPGPTDGQILDRLREGGGLPEVVSRAEQGSSPMASLRRRGGQLQGMEGARARDAARPRRRTRKAGTCPTGARCTSPSSRGPTAASRYFYDDVTERSALESRYNALIDVQRETLDH